MIRELTEDEYKLIKKDYDDASKILMTGESEHAIGFGGGVETGILRTLIHLGIETAKIRE